MRKIYTLTAIAAITLGLSGCNPKPAAENSADTAVETVAPPENAGAEPAATDNTAATADANAAAPADANATEGEALDGTGTPAGPGK